jgi:hypothetical protein
LVLAAEIRGICTVPNIAIGTRGQLGRHSGCTWLARLRSLVDRENPPSAHPLFDARYYLEKNPDVRNSRWPPLLHFLLWGGFEGRSPHPLFDPKWYTDQYPDAGFCGLNPLQHYIRFGWREGRNPHPLFNTAWYLNSYPEVKAAGCDPLVHFLKSGAAEGHQPHPLFDTRWYLRRYPEARESGLNPLVHYLLQGARGKLSPNRGFNAVYYAQQHPASVASGSNPLTHYVTGAELGCYDPHLGYPHLGRGRSQIVGSNLGKWDQWYENSDSQAMGAFRYGDTVTYRMAAAFMVDIEVLEDWGCGAGGFKRFYRGKYIGVDGSRTPFADRIVDLCTYESNVDGILIRHVLHNFQWSLILDAAVRSFNKRLCLILFTPFSDVTKEIAHNRQHGVDVPDISFCRRDIERKFSGMRWELVQDIATPTGYGIEHVYFVWKTSAHPVTTIPEPRLPMHQGLPSIPRSFRVSTLRKPRRALYTAIFGNYDPLKDIPEQPGVDLICFTDDTSLQHPSWRVRYVQPKYAHPRLSAKYYKVLSHVVLSEYDEVLWIDGSFEVHDPRFAFESFEYLEHASIALFLHPDRGCIYDEARVSQLMTKYRDQKIEGQVAHYWNEGFPAKAGLFAAGIIARRNADPKIRDFNEAWMEQNEKWTYQDQLSLPYVLWKLGIEPSIFRQYLWNSRWGVWIPHAHER